MSLVTMQKIRLFAHASAASDVLLAVQKAGVIEFTEVTDQELSKSEPTEFEFNYVSARLDFAVEFLEQYAEEKSGLAAMLEGSQERVTDTQIKEVAGSFYATDIVDAVQDLQKMLNDAQKKHKELIKEREALIPWQRSPFITGKKYDTKHTQTVFVVKNAAQIQKKKTGAHHALAEALDKSGVLYHIVSLDRARAVVTWEKDEEQKAQEVLKECGYDNVSLEQRRGTPAEEIERIDRSIIKTEKKISELELRAKELAQNLPNLKIVSDHTLWQKDRHKLFVNAHRTENVLVYEGWCPTHTFDQLTKDIDAVTTFFALEKIAPQNGEQPPVEVENSAMTRPFESVTRLYGLPGHRDLDPTPYLAGFFFIFFGFCLTDVGYGSVLMAMTGFALWRYDIPQSTATMLKLLFLGGLSSVFAGMLFGGYFGVDMAQMPHILQQIQLFDPIKDPLPVFYLSLALGLIQVLFGLCVAIISKAKNGKFIDGVLDHAPWIIFFITLGIFVADMMEVITFPLARAIFLGSVGLLVLTQGREAKNPFVKLAKGVMSLYDVVAYFSDILSYSRLLALGLATSALAFAVNMIAAMVAGEDPTVFSMVMAGIILVIGHVFNLVVNTLGAFIHSARLQFVEFFGKFISGTGRVFAPFRRTERYVIIKK